MMQDFEMIGHGLTARDVVDLWMLERELQRLSDPLWLRALRFTYDFLVEVFA